MMQGLLKEHSIERSEQASIIAKDIANQFVSVYEKTGVKVTKSQFYNLLIEVSYNTLKLFKFDADYTTVQKQPYINSLSNMIKIKGYTFFLQNETNRMAVLMHIRLMCK